MAKKLYSLALEIQGNIGGSLESSMKKAQGYLADLENKVKAYQEQHKNVGSLEAVYIRNSAAVQTLGQEIFELKKKQNDVSDYNAQRDATTETANAWRAAKQELKALTEANAKNKTKDSAAAMKAAATQANTLEKAYQKNKTSLGKMEEKLKAAGVNTKKLSEEQKNLANSVAKAVKEQEECAAAAEKVAEKLGKNRTRWAMLGKTVKGAAVGVASFLGSVSAASYGAFSLAKSTAETGDAAAKLGKKARASAEDIQKLQSLAGLSGVKDLSGALLTMTQNTDMAVKKQGEAVKSFKELRIRAKDFSNAGATKGLVVIAERLQQINDVSKRTRILKGLFGGQWAEMGEMLQQGPEAIKQAMKEAEDRGILSNESAAQSEEFLDNIQKMQESLRGLKLIIGDELRPVVNEIVVGISEWIKNNKELVQGKIHDWIGVIRDNLPKIRDTLMQVGEKIQFLLELFISGVDKIGGFQTALGGFGAYIAGKKVLGNINAVTQALRGMKSVYDIAKGIGGKGIGGVGTEAGSGVAEGALKGAGGGKMKEVLKEVLKVLGPMAATIGVVKVAHDVLYEVGGGEEVQRQAIENSRQFTGNNVPGLPAPEYDPSNDMWASFGGNQGSTRNDPEAETARKNRGEFSLWEKITGADKKWKAENPPPVQTTVQDTDASAENVQKVNVTVDVNAEAESANQTVAHHARGGLVSVPTLSTLSERGPEMVIPLSEAERGEGLFWLSEAARKLGVPSLEPTSMARKIPESPTPSAGSPSLERHSQNESTQNISFSPVIQITGDASEDTAQTILEQLRSLFPSFIKEAKDELERVSYATV